MDKNMFYKFYNVAKGFKPSFDVPDQTIFNFVL